MVTIETGFVAFTAVAIGLLAVLPALVGGGRGLLGMPLPVLDLQLVGGLVAATVLMAGLTAIPAGWRPTSIPVTDRS